MYTTGVFAAAMNNVKRVPLATPSAPVSSKASAMKAADDAANQRTGGRYDSGDHDDPEHQAGGRMEVRRHGGKKIH